MISFTENLSATSWTEILNGKGFVAFDCEKSSPVFVYFDGANSTTLSMAAWADSNNVTASFAFRWEEYR